MLSGSGNLTSDAFLEADVSRASTRKRPNVPMPLQKAQPPPWQRFLTDLNQRLDAGDRLTSSRRFAEGELIYTLDVAQTNAGRGLVVQVLHRQRKKNGDWAKPKPAAVSTHEVDDLPDPVDREIHARLLGAVDQSTLQSSYYGQVQADRATYLLVASAASRLLPSLAQTGRLHLTLERGQPQPAALAWDDGPAWRFDMAIVMEPGGSIRVDGSLKREGGVMTLAEPVLLLEAGFLITRVAVARFEPGEAFAWVTELRRSTTVTFPAAAADSLAEALARAGVRPDRLPEQLQYEVQYPDP